jgi:hypothetical protein
MLFPDNLRVGEGEISNLLYLLMDKAQNRRILDDSELERHIETMGTGSHSIISLGTHSGRVPPTDYAFVDYESGLVVAEMEVRGPDVTIYHLYDFEVQGDTIDFRSFHTTMSHSDGKTISGPLQKCRPFNKTHQDVLLKLVLKRAVEAL